MSTSNLSGKVIAITGGFGNLGQAVAREAVARGAQVALIGHGAEAASALLSSPDMSRVQRLNGVDLASPQAIAGALASVASEFGSLDALVNVAGGFTYERLEDGDPATWELMFNRNVMTAVSASKAALPHLLARGSGRIVHVGANAAAKAAAGMGPYAASKAGVARLTESLADELKDRGITVNAVLPSIIDTPQNRADMPNADFSRWVPASAIANVILFLVSDEAFAVTGALIPVSGRT